MARVFTNINSFRKWKKFAEKYDFKCVYCDKDLLENEYIYESAEVEHFIPRSEGGRKVFPSCHFCNKLKKKRKFANLKEARAELKKLREKYLKKYEFYELREKYRSRR